MNRIKLEECAEIIGGQVMSRVSEKSDNITDAVETRRIVVPKCINTDGTVNVLEMPEERLKAAADERKLTQTGDIIIKLSPPYDAGIIDNDSAGCLVPSFCAIIRCSSSMDVYYMLAFLNSSLCKDQLRTHVAGSVMTVLSVGKIKGIEIPVPDAAQQSEIGQRYFETQRKLRIIRQITEFETLRNDIVFREMVRKYEK